MARGIANKSHSLPWLLLLWLSVKLLAQIGLPLPLETDTTVPISVAIKDLSARRLSHGLCTNTGLLGNPTRVYRLTRPGYCPYFSTLIVLLMCGDVEINPGPRARQSQIFPCGYCQMDMNYSRAALCCDACDVWFHCSCLGIGTAEHNELNDHQSQSWDCYWCQNSNASSTYHSYNASVRNSFDVLTDTGHDSVFSLSQRTHSILHPGQDFEPPKHSSPITNPDTKFTCLI